MSETILPNESELIAVANEWQLAVQHIELASKSENLVYRVKTADGADCALRVHRPGYHNRQELDSEQTWTAALGAAGIDVPVARRKPDGHYYHSIEVGGEDRWVGIVEWLDGEPLARVLESVFSSDQVVNAASSTRSGAANQGRANPGRANPGRANPGRANPGRANTYMYQLGQLSACIHNQATGWQVPLDYSRHRLDVDGLLGDAPFWGPFWNLPELNTQQRKLIIRGRDLLRKLLNDYGYDAGTFSMIHADLHQDNILVADEKLYVIDFDDAGFGWHQYEIAVALFNYRNEEVYDDLLENVIAGYRSMRQLGNEALELVPVFILIRAMALLGWFQHRPDIKKSIGNQFDDLIVEVCARIEAMSWN